MGAGLLAKAQKVSCLFFSRLDIALENSFIAGAYTKKAVKRFASASFLAARIGSLLNSPSSLLGIILALGVLLPTQIQIAGVGFLVVLMLWKSCGSSASQTKTAPMPWQVSVALFAVFVFALGATVSSVTPWDSLKSLVIWCFSGAVFLLAYIFAAKGQEDRVIWPILTGISLSSVVGIYQHLTGWLPPRSWLDEKFEEEIVRIVGTFQNPNYLAEMIALCLPLAIALLIKTKNFRTRVLLLGFCFVQSFALVLTWSRGAWLGFIASCGIMAIMFDKRFLVLGLALAVSVVSVAPPVLLQRLLSSFTVNDSSNSYRISIWRGALAIMKKYLFRGIGLGNQAFLEIYPEHMIIQTPALHSHSVYFQMLIEFGVLGFLAVIFFLGTIFLYVISTVVRVKTKGWGRWVSLATMVGCLAAVAGNLLHGTIEHAWYNTQVMTLVWAWLGICLGSAVSYRHEACKQ